MSRFITLGERPYLMSDSTDNEVRRIEKYLPREQTAIDAFANSIRSTDIVFDVGANTGAYTLIAADLGQAVYSFEPMPDNVAMLHKNLCINGLAAFVRQVALGDRTGTTIIGGKDGADMEAGAGLNAIEAEKGIEVPVEQGADLGFPPDVLKIDVEGTEGLVLEGFGDMLAEISVVFLELHLPADHRTSVRDFGYTKADIIDQLTSYGHETTVIEMSDHELFLRAA